KFIALRVEQEKDPELAKALRISGFPTLVLAGADGRILNTLEGYLEAPRLVDALQRIVSSNTTPEWMLRDYQLAGKLVGSGEHARAIALLRSVVEDGAARPVQLTATHEIAP